VYNTHTHTHTHTHTFRYVHEMHHAMESIGTELRSRGFTSLGDFVLSTEMQAHVRQAAAAEEDACAYTAGKLVERLVRAFPELNDTEPCGAVLHRRAQIVAGLFCS
jgi:hypothetical protein